MLPRDRAEKILTLGKAGWPVRAIADQLGHSEPTIRGYLSGRTTPGVRAPRPSLLTDPLAGYCRQRFAEDPHLRPSTLFNELTELGFQASRSTFYRELTRRRLSPPGRRPSPAQARPSADPGRGIPRLPAACASAATASHPGHRRSAHLLPDPARPRQPPHPHRGTRRPALLVLHEDQQSRRSRPAPHAHPRNRRRPARTRPPHQHDPLLASPALSPPSAPPARTAPSGPPPPATGAPPAAGSTSPSPSTCPPTTRSAPVTASGSVTPASPTSTSPPARRSSPPSTGPAGSCAATRPRN